MSFMASIDDQQPATPSSSTSENNHERDDARRAISAVYCGPTMSDIQNALALTNAKKNILRSKMSITENKYVLRIKSNYFGMTDDGYRWRKYGQKSIKNSLNPRSYYKCTSPRCGAKKQVERSQEDQDTLIITYEGLHLHYYYPYSLNTQSSPTHKTTPSFKKAKKPKPNTSDDEQQSFYAPKFRSQPQEQGLLEDIVPFTIRNPGGVVANVPSSSSSTCSSSAFVSSF